MEYRGQGKDGVVVFEAESPPNGSSVRIEVVAEPANPPTIWEKLRRYSGAVSGLPSDLARNHDHYIHGTPRT